MSTEILTSGCSFKCQPKIAPLQTSKPKLIKCSAIWRIFSKEIRKNDGLTIRQFGFSRSSDFRKISIHGPSNFPAFRNHQTPAVVENDPTQLLTSNLSVTVEPSWLFHDKNDGVKEPLKCLNTFYRVSEN